jgi:DNA mismatch repair protein MutL
MFVRAVAPAVKAGLRRVGGSAGLCGMLWLMSVAVLPAHLVNKIAAGEVIERPASVVKELVENALDAGATRVRVDLEDGGKRLIAVTDDGGGMDEHDLSLAFAPHATSKIATEDDLFRIGTMGFRGEALASIASVSHAHICSARPPAAGQGAGGHEIQASGETLSPVKPCAAPKGTCVTVRDLFFNTPARRKFLKAAPTELAHAQEQLTRLALPRPDVAFVLTHNGRTITDLPAVASLHKRAADLFGQELAQDLLQVSPRRGALRVSGLIGTPAAARASGKWQYFFVNGRYVRDRLLSHALREAYRGVVDPTRWPAALVFIQVDPAEVDVNVHPTKIEVRFRDSGAVHGELLATLRETLNGANLAPTAALIDTGQPPRVQDIAAPDEAPAARPPVDPWPTKQQLQPASAAMALQPQLPQGPRIESLREAMADFFRSAPSTGPAAPPAMGLRPPVAAPAVAAPPQSSPMQVHNSYIVAQCDDGLIIIDQHAMHERLMYNDLRRRFESGSLAGQRMLLPVTIDATPREIAAASAHAELLAKLGIELAPFGPRSLAVQQAPSVLLQRGADVAEFVRQTLETLSDDEHAAAEGLLETLLESMACKAAVKAGQPLSCQEMQELLDRRLEADRAAACPHGRPTTLKLTLDDLRKQFKRS